MTLALVQSSFHIQPQHGWGWKKCDPNGRTETDDIPKESLRVQFSEFVTNDASEPVGFRGKSTNKNALDGFTDVLCLLHTCEWVSDQNEVIPVSIHCAHQSLEVCSEPFAPTGIAPVWGLYEGVIGFGLLVIEKQK
jgi:hypothetical protein